MTQRDRAIQFVEHFCAADVNGVEALLSPALSFTGPFFSFYNRRDYIDSLRRDPPEPARYELISATEDGTQVALFYNYIKPESTMNYCPVVSIQCTATD